MIREYYQIGGFRPHVDWPEYRYDDKKLAQIIAGDASPLRTRGRGPQEPIELVLGIKRTGTSHLLLSGQQIQDIVRAFHEPYPRAPPALSTDFESLSPIYFRNPSEFADKFGTLKIKTVKNRVSTDNSQSNKQFVSGDDGVQRGGFEHGRLLYQILHNPINPEMYSLDDTSWTRSFRVYSFVFTPRSDDIRVSAERRMNPTALDCGISEATIPELQLKAGSSIHLYSTNNRFMNAGSKKLIFQHGTTEELDSMVMSARLKGFFEEQTVSNLGPMILLVHDEEMSTNMLRKCGVDVSSWDSGLKGLLGFEAPEGRQGAGPSRSNDPRRPQQAMRDRHHDYDDRRTRPRTRSRSPNRSYDRHSYPSNSGPMSHGNSSRRTSPHRHAGTSGCPRRRAYAPVYIVDIKQQFIKLMQTASSSENVTKISQYLGLSDVDGWCAGNESVMMIDIWRSMISGPSIDEQRALNDKRRDPKLLAAKALVQSTEGGPVEYDSDQDPNEIVQEQAPVLGGDSDYGESSDSD
ncbi:hypothetical protein FPV67DRAFT_239018 [Lyophyllum atratum]|nr:hypothetical protein FPV67DRAFT_239018 [Lyophyllum atratum]